MKPGFAFNGPDFRCMVRSGGGGGVCKSKHKLFIKTVQRGRTEIGKSFNLFNRLESVKE